MIERHAPLREKSGVRRRAADIRRHWTIRERLKRLSLPPDMPQRLRSYLTGPYLTGRPERNWQ